MGSPNQLAKDRRLRDVNLKSHNRHGNVGDSKTRKLYEMYNSSAIVSAARLLPTIGSVSVNEKHASKWDRKVE